MFDKPQQPRCLPEFTHINRYWDRSHHSWAAKILPGEYYVATQPGELIATTLGSCVSACIRDRETGIGGMNHFMLPERSATSPSTPLDAATRYGSYAMEHLINDIIKQGGNRERLEIKLTGGGQIISGMSDVGRRNIDFVIKYLQTENLNVLAQDLGDIYPRKVIYDPESGRMRVKKLRNMHNDTLLRRENEYRHELEEQPVVSGSVELF